LAHPVRPLDEDLPMHGLSRAYEIRQTRVVDRNGTPAEQFEAFFTQNALPHAAAMRIEARVARHEQRTDGVLLGARQFEAELRALRSKEVMWDLDQHARAVARKRICAH